jgi:hypothetical protein
MQVTVNIPDELAARVQSRGIPLQTYVEQLVEDQISHDLYTLSEKTVDLDRFFAEITIGSENIPSLSDQVFTRESFYSDHD